MFNRVLAAMVLAGSFALLVGCTPSADETKDRIDAAKAALQSSVGGVSTDWAPKGKPLDSLSIKRSLPKKIGGMRIRSDVGAAFALGTLEGMVVEALYGDRESGVRLLVVDLATAERLDEHAGPGTEYRGGRIVEHKSAAGWHGLTYVSHGRFIVRLEATAVDLSVLRTGLDEVNIEHLHQLTGTR